MGLEQNIATPLVQPLPIFLQASQKRVSGCIISIEVVRVGGGLVLYGMKIMGAYLLQVACLVYVPHVTWLQEQHLHAIQFLLPMWG